jgi:hypothetical protein
MLELVASLSDEDIDILLQELEFPIEYIEDFKLIFGTNLKINIRYNKKKLIQLLISIGNQRIKREGSVWNSTKLQNTMESSNTYQWSELIRSYETSNSIFIDKVKKTQKHGGFIMKMI